MWKNWLSLRFFRRMATLPSATTENKQDVYMDYANTMINCQSQEWCYSYWYNNYNEKLANENNFNKKSNLIRVVRGGAWRELARSCRWSDRLNVVFTQHDFTIGFRIVQNFLPITL